MRVAVASFFAGRSSLHKHSFAPVRPPRRVPHLDLAPVLGLEYQIRLPLWTNLADAAHCDPSCTASLQPDQILLR